MEKAKRARKAETPKQPSLCLRLRAPYLYPDHSGSLTELENRSGDVKGKGTSGETARPKVPMCRAGADCLVVDPMQARRTEVIPSRFQPSQQRIGDTDGSPRSKQPLACRSP